MTFVNRENLPNFMDKIDEIEGDSGYYLASYADVYAPTPDTEGADFLDCVRTAFLGQVADLEFGDTLDPDAMEEELGEAAHERVDSMSHLIYTHTKWQVFTDLQLWDEEDELGFDTVDGMATGIVYQVGVRLWNHLTLDVAEALREDLEVLDEFRADVIDLLEEVGRFDLAEEVGEWDQATTARHRHEHEGSAPDYYARNVVGGA